jgi:hypothetical protein
VNRSQRAGPHVGQALVGDVLIRVQEKVKGSLAALLGIAESPVAKLTATTSFADREELVLYALIDRFLSLVDRYLSYGREKGHLTRQTRGGLPPWQAAVDRDRATLGKTAKKSITVPR